MAWLLDVECEQMTTAKALCAHKAHRCASTDTPVGKSTTNDINAAAILVKQGGDT